MPKSRSAHPKKQTQVMIIHRDSIGEMEIRLEECLKEGWELQGGISVSLTSDTDSSGDPVLKFFQLLVHHN